MPAEQNLNRARYAVIPRVLVYVTRGDELLLLKLLPKNGKVTRWTGRYNGLGGHIERGEDALAAAHRELFEESGIKANLHLCGVLIVQTEEADLGIELLLFTGEYLSGELQATAEGLPEWIPLKELAHTPLVEDGPVLIEKILSMQPGDPPFCARSFYDERGHLTVVFA